MQLQDRLFLRRHTERETRITAPGPFTMLRQAQNDSHASEEDAAMDCAAAVSAGIRDRFAAGADVVQTDEPCMQARPEKARTVGLAALNRAREGITGSTAVQICFGYAAIIRLRATGRPSGWPGPHRP